MPAELDYLPNVHAFRITLIGPPNSEELERVLNEARAHDAADEAVNMLWDLTKIDVSSTTDKTTWEQSLVARNFKRDKPFKAAYLLSDPKAREIVELLYEVGSLDEAILNFFEQEEDALAWLER